MSNVQKSFNTMGLTVILTNVTAAVIEAEKKAKSSGDIQTLDVLRPGLRQDIYIGKIMVIPPAVMDHADKVPLPLFKGAILSLFNGEDASYYEQHRLAESEFDELKDKHFSAFKDKVFKEDSKYKCLVMFLPAFANPSDYKGFKFTKEESELQQLIRHLVFGAYFNPSLSALYDILEESAITLDVKNIEHDHFGPTFDLMSAENAYPILGKSASAKKPFLRFAKENIDGIKRELLTPEEQAIIDTLSSKIVENITNESTPKTSSVNPPAGKCEGCGGDVVDSELLCESCKPKLVVSDEEDDEVERLAQEVAPEAENMVSDIYLGSDEDSMGLIEDIDSTTLDEANEEAIYEVMALKSVPYALAERVAERVKELLAENVGGQVQNESGYTGEDFDMDSLEDNALPPELQEELDAFDEPDLLEPLNKDSHVKYSFIDFFSECKRCGAVTPMVAEGEEAICDKCLDTPEDKIVKTEAKIAATEEKKTEYVEPDRKDDPTDGGLSARPDYGKEKKFPSFKGDEREEAHVKKGGLKNFRRLLRAKQVKKSNDDALARHIYWKCFENKDNVTMTNIKNVIGDVSFAELQSALMLLWKKSLVTPADKFNTWTKVGPETEKNTFTGKWPWNIHQAGRELKVLDRQGPYVIMSLRNDYLALENGEGEWTKDITLATRFYDEDEADDADQACFGHPIRPRRLSRSSQ